MFARRLVEVLVGTGLTGLCIYSIRAGTWRGAYRVYSRENEPFGFWAGVLITLAIGAAFLFGATSWRE
jgi:hypothetical protein